MEKIAGERFAAFAAVRKVADLKASEVEHDAELKAFEMKVVRGRRKPAG
ncbi:MAG: hypothetical protein WC068_14955 [Caulobacter sp.]